MASLPAYRGHFGPEQAERLLWRAGFGPTPGQAERLAQLGLRGAVASLTRPASRALQGPSPTAGGAPIAPGDAWGHEVLWWLDRMVRSRASLVERMTLVLHDWFATSIAGVDLRLALRQNATLRAHALGRFDRLALEVTRDPAMLEWLNGNQSTRQQPNENYARELLELFTLGAGHGYGERDVRELARSLTGFRNRWADGRGAYDFRFDRALHDPGVKRVFGRRGRFDWRDAVGLAVSHRAHPAFFVRKLWSYFIPTPPGSRDVARLASLYVEGRHAIRPVVEAILLHPDLHAGERMVKPPVVYVAGLLRGLQRGIDTEAWSWLTEQAGQRPFLPPNVAGWDDTRWIDTATWRGRWQAANTALEGRTYRADEAQAVFTGRTPAQAVDRALQTLGSPTLTATTRARAEAFAARCDAAATEAWQQEQFPVLRHNALLMLLATSPDLQTS